MDAEIFAAHRTFARALNARERGTLEILQRDEWLRDCAVLIDTMLAANQKLEPEAVRVETILRTLQRDSV